MAITINIFYHGKNGRPFEFAREMIESGIVDEIRKEPGNLSYNYYFPLQDMDTILLIDSWENQDALDYHHASDVMKKIAKLRNKYDLTMEVKYYVDKDVPEKDKKYIKK